MSPREFILTGSNAETLRVAAQWLRRATARSELLVIAPARAAADELACAACETGLLGVHRATLSQLAAEMAAQAVAARGLAQTTRLGMEALAARVVDLERRAGKLAYFLPVADTPGFARALASTLHELRSQDTAGAELARAGAPGADLAGLVALYEDEFTGRGLVDAAATLRLATEVARTGRHRLLGLPLILLNTPIETACQREFVAALVEKSPSVLATALASDEKAIRILTEIVAPAASPPAVDGANGSTALDRLRAFLFSTEALRPGASDETIEVFSAPGEGLECVEMARRIRRLAAQAIPFDRMAILLRSPERYQPLVEEALRRAGIPGYFSRGSARPDPAGRAFLALLACAAEGASASRFAEYLSLGQAPATPPAVDWVPPETDEFGDPIPPAAPNPAAPEEKSGLPQFAWEKLLVDAAVVGGRARWERRLKGLEQEFRLRLGELDGDDAERRRLARQLETLRELESFALPLIDQLASLPDAAPWGVWLERLDQIARAALREPESVLAVLAELQPMREVGPAGLEEVAAVLSGRLRFLLREPPVRRYGRVFVGSIDEARVRSFDVVFLPGLAEGLFPRRAFEDPLLLDVHRRKLDRHLDLQDDRVARERMLLRTAAAAAGARLIVSYPRMDAVQARPRVPSFYAMEVVRAAEGRLPDLRKFEQQSSAAATARLGWPAPADRRDAIDDAEYDLAALGPLIHGPAAEAKGKGRYLVAVNPHLGRSLRTRWRRWNNKGWSAADGVVDPDAAAAAVLAGFRPVNRPYSASTLQHYALCPYRFLLHGIHRLRPREKTAALEQMDPLTRGSLFHAAQFALFRAIELGGHGAASIQDLADRVLDRVAAAYEEKLAPAIPRVWMTSVEDLRMDVRGWIRELQQSLAEWRPIYYEFSFGLPLNEEADGHDARSREDEAIVLDGVRLRGSIDVVEKHQTRAMLRITDHKTGKAPENPPLYVGRGVFLQPLLYALAAEKLFGEPVESGRLFYCTQRGNYEEFVIPLNDGARARIRQVLDTIDRAVAEGFLPAAPQPDTCETCDYRPVCGPYEETRVRSKRADPRLEGLVELRRIP